MPTVDLRQDTARVAAKKVYGWCRKMSEETGQDPDIETFLWSPAKSQEMGYSRAWAVGWEAGPYDWTISLTGEEDPYFEEYAYEYQAEFGEFPKRGPAPFRIAGARKFLAEPYSGSLLMFFDD